MDFNLTFSGTRFESIMLMLCTKMQVTRGAVTWPESPLRSVGVRIVTQVSLTPKQIPSLSIKLWCIRITWRSNEKHRGLGPSFAAPPPVPPGPATSHHPGAGGKCVFSGPAADLWNRNLQLTRSQDLCAHSAGGSTRPGASSLHFHPDCILELFEKL